MKKKWLLCVLVLVIVGVALAVVFFDLFAARNTKALASQVIEVTDTGYLNSQNEANKQIDSYFSKIANLSELKEDKAKIQDYANFFTACEEMGQFFRRQIVFTRYTSSYASNLGKIKRNLNAAQKKADEVNEFLKTTLKVASGSSYWEAETWKDCKENIVAIMNNTAEAFIELGEVYQTSVDSKLMNNDFTKVLFMVMNENLNDVKSKETTSGGAQLQKIVGFYMTKTGERKIINFNYSENMQTTIATILEADKSDPLYQTAYQKFLNGQVA